MVLGVSVNLWAVLVAGIASMVVGSIWYGPLFGKQWMKFSGISKQKLAQMKKKGMGKTYLLAFIGSLVMAFVLGVFIQLADANSLWSGVVVAFWAWLGFVATETLGTVLWDDKPSGMFWLHGIGALVGMAIMGAILVSWA